MSTTSTSVIRSMAHIGDHPRLARPIVGFVAGALAVLVFSSSVIEILHAAALFPMPGWSLMPVRPFGVPQSLVSAFWGGVWGVVYALLEPRLTKHLGWWAGGLAFAALPFVAFLFVVPALKAMPIGPGLAPTMFLLSLFLHAVFGLGAAILFRLGAILSGGRTGPPELRSNRSPS